MDKRTCKLCHKKFANGRSLGGHMRSHMILLPIPPKKQYPSWYMTQSESESLSSSSASDDDDEVVGDDAKYIMLTDLEDQESETESTQNPSTRKRTRRHTRKPSKLSIGDNNNKGILCDTNYYNNDLDPMSSISEVSSEEDLAFCLMMLSRDKWGSSCHGRDYCDIIGDVTNSYKTSKDTHKRCTNKYMCDTCNKVFRSYQALGGHRASHKKTRVATEPIDNNNNNNNDNSNYEGVEVVISQIQQKKTHECPVCFRVFASGQALGGHKRSHVVGNIENQNPRSSNVGVQSRKKKKMIKSENTSFIDLNLPAPVDDEGEEEEISQIDVSVVSDAHL